MKKLIDIIEDYIDLNNVLFITTNSKLNSSDYDIYILAKNNEKSSVHIFYKAV